jgi:hypothetical protein
LGFWPSDFVPNPDLAAAERELWLISWPLGSLDAIVPGWMRYRLNYYWFRESLDFPAIKPWGAEPSLEYKTTSRGGQGPLGMVLKPGNSLDSAPKAEKIPLSSGIYASIAAQCGGRNPRPRSPVERSIPDALAARAWQRLLSKIASENRAGIAGGIPNRIRGSEAGRPPDGLQGCMAVLRKRIWKNGLVRGSWS